MVHSCTVVTSVQYRSPSSSRSTSSSSRRCHMVHFNVITYRTLIRAACGPICDKR